MQPTPTPAFMTEPTQQTVRHILEFPKEYSSLVKDWMPVIQSAIWPLVLLVVLLAYRRHLLSILYSFAERVGRQGFPATPSTPIGEKTPRSAASGSALFIAAWTPGGARRFRSCEQTLRFSG
jgi:hypothetical protein